MALSNEQKIPIEPRISVAPVKPVLSEAKPILPIVLTPPVELKIVPALAVDASPIVTETSTPGRGGQLHKQIQALIKQWAEGMGYRATVEKTVLNGMGSVDVALEKGSRTIACEISITTAADQEISNIKKCVSAGFQHVFLVCTEADKVGKMKQSVSKGLTREELGRTRFGTPDELFTFVQEIESKEASGERIVKGWKVKVNYRPINSSEREQAEQSIAQALVTSAKKKMATR